MGSITVEFRGYLGQAPTVRFSAAGHAVAELRVGVNRRTKHEGEWVDAPMTWLTVTAFNQLGENVAESLDKGDPVHVRGELVTEQWKSHDGEDRTGQKVLASEISVPLNTHVVRGVHRTRKEQTD